jgi:hypothetical protein
MPDTDPSSELRWGSVTRAGGFESYWRRLRLRQAVGRVPKDHDVATAARPAIPAVFGRRAGRGLGDHGHHLKGQIDVATCQTSAATVATDSGSVVGEMPARDSHQRCFMT